MRFKTHVGPKITSIDLFANGDDSKVGELHLARVNAHLLVGRWIHVEPELRRYGWGTRLWEQGLRVARAQGLQLASDKTRSPFMEAFWRKQAAKGRAECIQRGRGTYHTPPLLNLATDMRRACAFDMRMAQAQGTFPLSENEKLWLDRCVLTRVRAALRHAPKPAGKPNDQHWPCRRWGIRPTYAGSALDGLRGRQR
jgi:GNAT superfamily N-acetyltransferase